MNIVFIFLGRPLLAFCCSSAGSGATGVGFALDVGDAVVGIGLGVRFVIAVAVAEAVALLDFAAGVAEGVAAGVAAGVLAGILAGVVADVGAALAVGSLICTVLTFGGRPRPCDFVLVAFCSCSGLLFGGRPLRLSSFAFSEPFVCFFVTALACLLSGFFSFSLLAFLSWRRAYFCAC